MSVVSMTGLAVRARTLTTDGGADPVPAPPLEPGGGAPGGVPGGAAGGAAGGAPANSTAASDPLASYIKAVVAFIPSEAVAGYIALWAFISPTSTGERWTLFGVGVVVTAALVVISFLLQRRRQRRRQSKRLGVDLTVLVVFALLAFTTWAGALPDSPFASLYEDATRWFGAAIIVLALLLPGLSELLGVKAVTASNSNTAQS